MNNVKAVILAGGQGVRFWPISRAARPKQFLSVSANGDSLIQATVKRVIKLVGLDNVIIVGSSAHKSLLRTHIPLADVIFEPCARNTAASIGLAALHVRREDPDACMVVLPADHSVKNERKLLSVLRSAITLAEKEPLLVTVGIKPNGPNTAYGYIQRGKKISAHKYHINRFFEKPNLERAKQYLESGEFFWNSGMFVWRASVLLDAIAEFMPELHAGLTKIDKVLGTKAEVRTVAAVFESLPSVSIDFGVLEHARNCAVVIADEFGWNDVGSWDAWAEHFERDRAGNLLHGDALEIDSRNCVVYSKNKLVAVLGVEDLVVIDSEDALLVCPRARVQDIKKIVDELKKRGRRELV